MTSDPDRAEIKANLGNWRWRLNNVYHVINEKAQKVKFKFRFVQDQLFSNLHKRNIVLKARKFGITTFMNIFMTDLTVFRKNVACGMIGHNKDFSAQMYRDKVLFAYDNLSDDIRAMRPAIKRDGGMLVLQHSEGKKDTSSFKIAASMTGHTPNYLHVSELAIIAQMRPDKAQEIKRGALPSVPKDGFICIECTARGREGLFADMWQESWQKKLSGAPFSKLDYFPHFFPWYLHPDYTLNPEAVVIPKDVARYLTKSEKECGVKFTPGQKAWYAATLKTLGDDMMAEFPATPEEAFLVSIEGAYYKRQMDDMYREGRITSVPWNSKYPVYTSWDIGHHDATAIWFYQIIDGWVHFIDYEEMYEEGLPFFADMIKSKPYKYAVHTGPHDLMNVIWGTSKTAVEEALALGIQFQIAPKMSIIQGINVVRQMLKIARIDEANCARGLSCMQSYTKEWNKIAGCWKVSPAHTWASHGADSLRYAGLTLDMEQLPRFNSYSVMDMATQ